MTYPKDTVKDTAGCVCMKSSNDGELNYSPTQSTGILETRCLSVSKWYGMVNIETLLGCVCEHNEIKAKLAAPLTEWIDLPLRNVYMSKFPIHFNLFYPKIV